MGLVGCVVALFSFPFLFALSEYSEVLSLQGEVIHTNPLVLRCPTLQFSVSKKRFRGDEEEPRLQRRAQCNVVPGGNSETITNLGLWLDPRVATKKEEIKYLLWIGLKSLKF